MFREAPTLLFMPAFCGLLLSPPRFISAVDDMLLKALQRAVQTQLGRTRVSVSTPLTLLEVSP